MAVISTSQLREFVTALPPATKFLLATSLLLSTFEIFWWQVVLKSAAAPAAADGTTVPTPWSLLQLQPSAASSLWTLLTAPLVETNILILFGNLLALSAAGRYFEPVWGSLEFARFVVGVNGVAHLALLATCIFWYATSLNTIYLYDTFIHGQWAVLAGLTVAWKQASPERSLNFEVVAFRVKRLPFGLFVVAALMYTAFGNRVLVETSSITYGLLISWAYLRFYQRHSSSARGDRSEAFAFVMMLPEPLQPVLRAPIDMVYAIVTLLRLVSPKPKDLEMLGSKVSVMLSNPIDDSERRAQVGLKALESRLQQQQHQPSPSTNTDAGASITLTL